MNEINLPEVKILSDLDKALNERASVRRFKPSSLDLETVSKLLWAANGKKVESVSSATRILPSAGATYPLEAFLVAGEGGIKGLEAGVYLYDFENNRLLLIKKGDIRGKLMKACLGQKFIEEAPITIVIAADFNRTVFYYGERGRRYVISESGHASQNIYLMATSLGLGTVEVGAFYDDEVKKVLNLPKEFYPLSLMPVGIPAE